MKRENRFESLAKEEQDWIDAYVDGTISEEDFATLQDRMAASPVLRAVMRRYLALDGNLRGDLGEGEFDGATAPWLENDEDTRVVVPFSKRGPFAALVPVAAAAVVAFLLGSAVMYFGKGGGGDGGDGSLVLDNSREPSAEGFAVVGRLLGASWYAEKERRREGDSLGAEIFRLAEGTAEIRFFSGATMTVEGPAEIVLSSAWEADCREGAVRMRVPPAARGFKLNAPETEIVDLGTEFGLEVRKGRAHVEVFDGEILMRHQGGEKRLVEKGAAWGLPIGGEETPSTAGEVAFPDSGHLAPQATAQRRSDYERWIAHRDALARDERLIAYYTFDRENPDDLVPNVAGPRDGELDGAVVLAEPVDGRWPGMKSALEFRRPGSRVRVNLPGEFPAFTFMCWVRIDSLDRWYNALFMGDGYETGEPHWQIRDDGVLMLSVMVDDARPNPSVPTGKGIHHIYSSPPIWDRSMSGQWLHVASVFDPAAREVSHYVDGELVDRQEIEERFFIETLRIGNGEIGNWGLPKREDPTFAIRNLNGRMDELAIFRAALQEEEIAALYAASRSESR